MAGTVDTAGAMARPELTVALASGAKDNDATVTRADIVADNGMIPVIGSVLLPPGA